MKSLLALSAMLVANLTVTSCSEPGPAGTAKQRNVPAALPRTVGCDQVIQQVGPPGGRLVLGVLAAPPSHLEHAATTGALPWPYFAKYGIAIRAGSPAVLITVPDSSRRRAAIGWGNDARGVSSLRIASCPRQLGAWNAYAGGFYLLSPSDCVPLVFTIGRQTATLSVAIGRATCGSAR